MKSGISDPPSALVGGYSTDFSDDKDYKTLRVGFRTVNLLKRI